MHAAAWMDADKGEYSRILCLIPTDLIMQALAKQTRAAFRLRIAREGWSFLAACASSRSHPPGAKPALPKHLEPYVEAGELHYDTSYR